MRMASAPPTETNFLRDCFSVPVVRDRLEKGVKLQELVEIKKFLELNREQEYLKKEYGYLIQDLEFLESVGALRMPAATPGRYVTLKPHWIAIRGYFEVNQFTLAHEGVESRFIINTPSLFTPILTLDTDAWQLYSMITRAGHLSRYQALAYLVYILEVLHLTDLPLGQVVTPSYVRYAISTYDPDGVLEEAKRSYVRLMTANRIDDPKGTLLRILNETYCLPTNDWIFSDGWYYLATIPSWTMSSAGHEDYSGNYVQSWDFFTCEV